MDSSKLVEDLMGRVRAALDEAEEKSREIIEGAEKRAKELIASAETDAEKIRDRAEKESQARLSQVRDALSTLETMVGSSGTGHGAPPESEVDPGPVEVPEPMPPVEPEPSPPVEPEPMPPAEPEPMPPEPEIEPPAPAAPDRESPQMANGSASERSQDATAARIVAMKMALDGVPREEIGSHIDENYEIESTDALLDAVMARAKR